MQAIWMGIVPDAAVTRVRVVDGAGVPRLTAQLLPTPRHPRALTTLCEAIALWYGQRVRVAVAADTPGASCATTPWLETFDALAESPLIEIDFVTRARPPRSRAGADRRGDVRTVPR